MPQKISHRIYILWLFFTLIASKTDRLYDILSLTADPFYGWFGCADIITKAAVYAIDRIEALKKTGFIKAPEPLTGQNEQKLYYDYWIRRE